MVVSLRYNRKRNIVNHTNYTKLKKLSYIILTIIIINFIINSITIITFGNI